MKTNTNKKRKKFFETVQFLKDFTESRTNFWIALIFILLWGVGIPLTTWLLIGKDFSFSYYLDFAYPRAGWVLLYEFLSFILTLLLTFFTFSLRWHKEDLFLINLAISFLFFGVSSSSLFLGSTTLAIILRLLYVLTILIIGFLFSGLIFMLFRNRKLKKQEDLKIMIDAYKKGEQIPTRKKINIERIIKYQLKQEQKINELNDFKQKLNKKIDLELKQKKDK